MATEYLFLDEESFKKLKPGDVIVIEAGFGHRKSTRQRTQVVAGIINDWIVTNRGITIKAGESVGIKYKGERRGSFLIYPEATWVLIQWGLLSRW